jgi:hypothetical protein
MERCPPEILSRIFVLACADGGRAGSALTRVSTHVAAQAAPYRFWSVRVAGARQLQLFERALRAAPPHLRCAHHLFVSDRAGPRTRDFEYDAGDALILSAAHDRVAGASEWVRNALADAELFSASFPRVLALLADSLHTIALLIFAVHRPGVFAALAHTHFARLSHFTLVHKHLPVGPDDAPAGAVAMPVLRVLALGSLGRTAQRWPWIAAFVGACPLDTLVLRGLSFDANTRHALRHLLGLPPVPFPPHARLNIADPEWMDGLPWPMLARPVRCIRLREFLETGDMYALHRLTDEEFQLLEDGVQSLRVRKRFPDYAQLEDEWTWMVGEKALDFALA